MNSAFFGMLLLIPLFVALGFVLKPPRQKPQMYLKPSYEVAATERLQRQRRRESIWLIVFQGLLAAILFAAMYVVWNYYPHPQIQLPIVPGNAYSMPPAG